MCLGVMRTQRRNADIVRPALNSDISSTSTTVLPERTTDGSMSSVHSIDENHRSSPQSQYSESSIDQPSTTVSTSNLVTRM